MAKRLSKLVQLSYPITRPFPHAGRLWFGVVICNIILGILFAFVAVATNAYVVQSIYTSDPNGTEAQREWFQARPFNWFGSLQTSCQDSLLTVGDTFLTTNNGLTYTLSRIRKAVRDQVEASKPLSQVLYHNTTLRDCAINSITVDFRREVQSDNFGNWATWANTVAQAYVACYVDGSTTDTHQEVNTFIANFTVALPRMGIVGTLVETFPTQLNYGLKSMWYGVQLTNSWFAVAASALSYSVPSFISGDSWASGTAVFIRNTDVTDWRDSDYFFVTASFPTTRGLLAVQGATTLTTFKDWQKNDNKLPTIEISTEAFAKSWYALLAIDLGIQDQNNPLSSKSGVQYLLGINDTVATEGYAQCRANGTEGSCRPGTIDQFKVDDTSLNDALSSRLQTQYLCSRPTQKSNASVAYSVILAILVFLRAAWSLFSTIAAWSLTSGDERANHCVGCATTDEHEGIMLKTPSRSKGSRILGTRLPNLRTLSDQEVLLSKPSPRDD